MVGFVTQSGAVYTINGSRVLRTGPFSRGIDYSKVPDDSWLYLRVTNQPIEVGKSVKMSGADGWRITTPVVEVFDVE